MLNENTFHLVHLSHPSTVLTRFANQIVLSHRIYRPSRTMCRECTGSLSVRNNFLAYIS